MRVVLDTNLIVRAARPHAGLAPSILLEALSDRHVLLLSNGLFSEIYKVLSYERVRQVHGLNDAGVHEFFDAIAQGAEIVVMQPLGPGPLVPADPTDDTVLLTAIHGRADALGTINRHFFATETMAVAAAHGIQIMTDIELLDLLRR